MDSFLLKGIFLVLLTFGRGDLCGGTFINLVSVTGQNPRFGLVPTGPAYDVAIANALAKFPIALQTHNTIRRYEVYKQGIFSCDEAGVQMQMVAGQVADIVERLDGFTVLLCPGCSLEIMVLGDFAREWDVPLLASSASDQRLANKKRYPTVTAYGPVDLLSFANAAKTFMDRHSWRIATLLCDKLSGWPGLSTVYILLCSNIRMKLESQLGVYTINVIQFDSKKVEKYDGMLETVRAQSRIVFIFTRPSVLREILVTADAMNMTNGEFVFIAPESTKQPTLGDVSWRDETNASNGKDNAAAFRAFQSTITMFHPSPNLRTSGAIFAAINELSRSKYNYTLTPDEEMNDVVICAYESVGTLAMVLNETYTRLDNMTGRIFSDLLRNKTYELDILEIYVDEYGMKKGDVQFLRLNKTTKLFQEAWLYSTFYKKLSETSRIASEWYGRGSVPLDAPRCGYRGEKCLEKNSTVLLIVVLCPLGILTLSALVALCKWRFNQIQDRNCLWWCMDPGHFDQDASAVTFGTGGTPMADLIARQDLIIKYQFKLRMYQSQVVWTEAISPNMSWENIGRRLNMKKMPCRCKNSLIKNLRHENVGQFYGVMAVPSFTCLVWEFGTHGSLRMLLDADESHAKNIDLLVSMMWDILKGVDYIHSTDLHFHGSCSSLTAMLDKRFCIRLCGYGSAKMLSLLTGSNVANSNDTIKLWMAPEMLHDPTHQGSKQADTFSVALIILEIFTRCTPMDVILESETSCKHGIENLTTLKIPRIPITQDVPQLLHDTIRQSFLTTPKDRPSLKTFIQIFGLCFTNRGFVDKILSRLQKYSEDLEIKVEAQTHELIEEQRKVDALLAQMIPKEFVDRLRNKEVVPCESFDCATIFFSDLPQFGAICASSSPLQIIALLNNIYSTFDVILEHFDVYKVETVNDSYMVVSGLPKRNGNLHVSEIARMAIALINTKLISPVDQNPLHLRVGIHSGLCVAGIVGLRLPRYCLFGDTVNTASRMESHGEASRIHISSATRELLSVFPGFVLHSRGKIAIKGKGDIETYWLLGQYEP